MSESTQVSRRRAMIFMMVVIVSPRRKLYSE